MDLFLGKRWQVVQDHSIDQLPVQTRLHHLKRVLTGTVRNWSRSVIVVAD
jgi:hypothetical protein